MAGLYAPDGSYNVTIAGGSAPSGSATATNQTLEISALGATNDSAYAGSGNSSIVAALKGIYAQAIAAGTVAAPSANVLSTQPARVSTASITTLASAATSAQLLASTTTRAGLMLTNTDANDVYVKYGTTASATSFTVKIPGNGGYWEMPKPIYTGRIDAIWVADGAGSLIATEL